MSRTRSRLFVHSNRAGAIFSPSARSLCAQLIRTWAAHAGRASSALCDRKIAGSGVGGSDSSDSLLMEEDSSPEGVAVICGRCCQTAAAHCHLQPDNVNFLTVGTAVKLTNSPDILLWLWEATSNMFLWSFSAKKRQLAASGRQHFVHPERLHWSSYDKCKQLRCLTDFRKWSQANVSWFSDHYSAWTTSEPSFLEKSAKTQKKSDWLSDWLDEWIRQRMMGHCLSWQWSSQLKEETLLRFSLCRNVWF